MLRYYHLFIAFLVVLHVVGGNTYANGDGMFPGYQQPSGGMSGSNVPTSLQIQPFAQQQHQQQHLVSQNGHISFREIDDMDRETVLQYVLDVLRKAVAENDTLKRRPGQTITRLAGDEKLFYDELDAHVVAEPLGDRETREKSSSSSSSSATLHGLFEKLSSSGFRIRNLTIVIALSYMDKVANILHLYATSRTVRRLFGGCLIIASKMHQNEVSREELADALCLSLGDLVNIESAIVLSVRDLTVHPQTLANYVRPLMAARSATSEFTSPPPYNPGTQSSFSQAPQYPQQQQQQHPQQQQQQQHPQQQQQEQQQPPQPQFQPQQQPLQFQSQSSTQPNR